MQVDGQTDKERTYKKNITQTYKKDKTQSECIRHLSTTSKFRLSTLILKEILLKEFIFLSLECFQQGIFLQGLLKCRRI
jgi:hypothetical protein